MMGTINLNTIYLNKDDISSAEVYRTHKVGHLYIKEFQEFKFLGIIWDEKATRYSTDCMPQSRDWGNKSKESALYYFGVTLKDGSKVYYKNNQEFFFIDNNNDIFLKTYVIITTKGGKKYTRFFDNETEVETYLDDVGIRRELYALDYSNSI